MTARINVADAYQGRGDGTGVTRVNQLSRAGKPASSARTNVAVLGLE